MKKKKNQVTPKVESEVATVEVPAQKEEYVHIKNNSNQVVAVNIRKKDGKLIGIQLDANASRQWPKLSDYGPDASRLIARKVIRLDPVKT